ncbi:hypothetical protein [Tenacibaculum singaporense]|uniref:Uncharacterized protein n=1 Tax=Tenacibaculum singaporense TaxID=2358479 RepID=A0A3Q8RTK0_9FLAO|nr:hypothetical protein [Tenacibaculum singaporense]AZJ35986.1 hypothetical protein D6T69_10810 [Tenacibaculum singaporense]
MKEKIIFEGKSKIREIVYDNNSNLFYFSFEEIHLIPTDFWRFFKNNKIELISKDHNLKYSFQEPKIDLISFLNKEFKNDYLLKIEITNNNDLILYFSSTKKIEVYITSMAFENWEITIKNKQYICLQGGDDIAVIE